MGRKKVFLLVTGMITVSAAVGGTLIYRSFTPASVPDRFEYLAEAPVQLAAAGQVTPVVRAAATPGIIDFADETVGADPTSFAGVVGFWVIGTDGVNRVMVVDGRRWSRGKATAGLAEKARALYGERYAEFLDNVTAYAYYPYAVTNGVDDFSEGEITLRFKGIDGRIDQAAGILFNLKPNGDYYTLRANCLEDNLVLWKFKRGRRSSVEWARGVPTPSRTWHELRLRISGTKVTGYLNGKVYLVHRFKRPVSGRVGVWSKADSVVYFDDFTVKPTG